MIDAFVSDPPLNTLAHISFTGVDPAPRVRTARALLAPERDGDERDTPEARGLERDEGPLDPFMAWMLGRAGLRAAAYRAGAMRRRVPACLRRLRVATPDCARTLLEKKPELLPGVINTALIGVSEFFRDRAVFERLATEVLPRLLGERKRLRVCSAGVSSGQELYSVAMLLAEAGALERVELLGVDCRPEAIRRARAGIYRSDDLAGVDAERRARFFRSKDGMWEISPVIKKRIHWDIQDLLGLDAGEPCDLILFRNVAIYLNDEHSSEAWARIDAQLAPGGFVVAGRAERPPASLPFTRVASSIYQKHAL